MVISRFRQVYQYRSYNCESNGWKVFHFFIRKCISVFGGFVFFFRKFFLIIKRWRHALHVLGSVDVLSRYVTSYPKMHFDSWDTFLFSRKHLFSIARCMKAFTFSRNLILCVFNGNFTISLKMIFQIKTIEMLESLILNQNTKSLNFKCVINKLRSN